MGLDKLTNSRFQFGHAGEDTPIQCPPFQLREPAFHGVQPRSTGRREVQFETRVLLQPLLDGRCFVRRAVVQNHMQVKLCGRRAVDLSQKGQKLFGPVALGYPPDNLAGQDVKSGIQAGGAMAFVIMRASLDLARA